MKRWKFRSPYFFLKMALLLLASEVIAAPIATGEIFDELSCQFSQKEDATVKSEQVDGSGTVVCQYRYSQDFKPQQLSLDVDGERVSLSKQNIKKYPVDNQATAILVLLDVSDPRRQDTVTNYYPKIIKSIVEGRPKHWQIGLSTFAESLEQREPITSEIDLDKIFKAGFSATGRATEMNRLIKESIQSLIKVKADRRILLVISDGKAEDTAYPLAETISLANQNKIPVLGLGIAEKATDLPSLQSLRKLSEETGGRFVDLSSKEEPNHLARIISSVADLGGQFSFEAKRFYGERRINVTLTDAAKNEKSLSMLFDFPDSRTSIEKISAFIKTNLKLIVSAVVLFSVGIFLFIRYSKAIWSKLGFGKILAIVKELDGSESAYKVRKKMITIGRSPQNDICLKNSSVSLHHAEIHQTRDGGFQLTDLSSTNGCAVNGERVSQADLKDGDLLEIAEVRLRFNLSV